MRDDALDAQPARGEDRVADLATPRIGQIAQQVHRAALFATPAVSDAKIAIIICSNPRFSNQHHHCQAALEAWMSDAQSSHPQPCPQAHLQQISSKNLLLIRCRSPEQRDAADPDSSSKTSDLDQPDPPDPTEAREICC